MKVGDMVHARTGKNVVNSYGGAGLIIGHSWDLGRGQPLWTVLWSKTGHTQSHGKMEIQVMNESR
jgi:hypothetical protein